eukprot:CAMPEP_0198216728 /NCGR_PEP_ID=MMETSP1445-20131203/59327_1 /TAXON_ID=36898 /ORGANISM="Pyramimonas sp., Strain CCMP2087" /LENGTH=288 /DNA_ID=CAMNT_0043893105 /DNA_START=187 /DNA_END=1050 /DNA_ORIENTATION=-
MSRLETLQTTLKASVASLPPVLRSCTSHALAERIYPTFQESEFRSQQVQPLEASIGQTRWTELAEALNSTGSSNKSASDEAVLLASTTQLEAALRGQLEDGLPDLRGLLPMKVAATTPTPPPWVVSCKTCRRVVLASKFRTHMDKCLAMASTTAVQHHSDSKTLKHSSNKGKLSTSDSSGSKVKRKRTAVLRDGAAAGGRQAGARDPLEEIADATRPGRNRPRKMMILSDEDGSPEAKYMHMKDKSGGGDLLLVSSQYARPALLFQPVPYRWNRNVNFQGLLANMYYA